MTFLDLVAEKIFGFPPMDTGEHKAIHQRLAEIEESTAKLEAIIDEVKAKKRNGKSGNGTNGTSHSEDGQ